MEKEFVDYQTALALKELGFDEKCFGKYYYVKEHEIYDPRKGEDFTFGDNNRIILRDNPCSYGYDENEITLCVAPTFSQAFRFFRGKYDLHSVINRYPSGAFSFNIDYFLEDEDKHEEITWGNKSYSYEEAELECIKKLIEICQTKK